ncbi:MAG: zinc-ribbon domain-containing protein [Ruminococcaceae bacterium]|nr:zinc-ribbon domain-containing protein [Oscillospiraceae bacterium]
MAKYCTHCGNPVNENAVICLKCGCEIKDSVNEANNKKTSLNGNVSLACGIIGIIFAWIFALVGHIASIIGIVYGIKENQETGKSTGLVLGIIGEVCSVISSAIGVMISLGLV